MSGTKAGGLKAAKTMIDKYGADYYSIQGRKGGVACVEKGFAKNRTLARLAGAKGGRISKRGKSLKNL